MVAAEQALDGWALEEAVSHYNAALDLAPDDATRRRIRLARGLARSRLDDFQAAIDDLGELLPELSGRERVEGLLGWNWGNEWTERSEEAIAGAQEAFELAQAIGDEELVAVTTGRLSQGLAMRGHPGDLDRAAELGQKALDIWVPGSRSWDLINHQHMFGEQLYWMGRLAEAGDLMAVVTESESDPLSLQARLRSASLRAMVLTSTGRYEEGLALFDQTLELAQKLGRSTRIVQNYSTLPLRELFDLDEAKRRTEEALVGAELLTGFTMPRAMAMAPVKLVTVRISVQARLNTSKKILRARTTTLMTATEMRTSRPPKKNWLRRKQKLARPRSRQRMRRPTLRSGRRKPRLPPLHWNRLAASSEATA